MGRIVEFPEARRLRLFQSSTPHAEPAHIIILPVVRIERHPDKPSDGVERGATSNRRRRRRARS